MAMQSISLNDSEENNLPHKPLFSVHVIFFTYVYLTKKVWIKNLQVFKLSNFLIEQFENIELPFLPFVLF